MLPSGLRLSQRVRLPVKFKMLAAVLVIPRSHGIIPAAGRMTVLLLLLAVAAVCSAGWQWHDSQLRVGEPVVADTKAVPEVLWPMATLRTRAFVPYRAALKKTGTE